MERALTKWIPKYIKTKIKDKTAQRIDANYWNSLWNLVISQGDNNADGILGCLENCEILQTKCEEIQDNIPTKISELENDSGYLSEETDPTVPAWAKASNKPEYTAAEVGADTSGSAAQALSDANAYTDKQILNIPKPDVSGQIEVHNTSTGAHADIRELIDNLDTEVDKKVNTSDIDALYAELDKKVNTSDIINDLITSVSNKPLSAKQGTVLKKSIDTLTSEVENLDIPTKISELENDGNYILTEDETKDVVETNYFDSDSQLNIVWDGNIEGHLCVFGCIYKVSDETPDISYFNGTSSIVIVKPSGNATVISSDWRVDESVENATVINDEVYIISEAGTDYRGFIFPEVGVYFRKEDVPYVEEEDRYYVAALTRSSGSSNSLFTSRSLKKSLLPPHKHNWDSIIDPIVGDVRHAIGSDTVLSDNVDYRGLHKVSDAMPSEYDLSHSGSITYIQNGETVTETLLSDKFEVKETSDYIDLRIKAISLDDLPITLVRTVRKGVNAGTYFNQNSLWGIIVQSLTLTDFGGFEYTETRKLDSKYLPDTVGKVKTVNNISPDSNGNVRIETGSGSGVDSSELLANEDTDRLIWDGDTSGLVTAGNYYKLSDDTPTADDLLFGGTYTFDNGNSMTFTSDNLDTSTANIILVNGGYAVIVLADSAVWDNTTFPEAGIYLINDGDFYIAEFRINRYSFTRKVLDLDYLPTHTHEWSELGERKLETGGNTVTSDGIVYDRYIKVSDIVPTSTELTGGTISYCPVTDGVKGELVTATFPEGIYTIVGTNPIQIACDGYVLAVIATKASSSYTGVTEAGTYFCQNSLFCVESLTINGYTGYPSAEIVPVSKEYLPAPSWNDLEDKPFGETTETTSFDTLTWDGNTDGHYSQTYDTTTYCKISDNLPTNEELQQGGTLSISANGEEMSVPFAGDDLGITQEDGSDYTIIGENAIVNRSETAIEDITLTPGLYFVKYTEDSDETYTTSLTINDYEFTETTTVVKKLDSKFTHNADWNANEGEDGFILNRPFGEMIVQSDTLTWDGNTYGLETMDVGEDVGTLYRLSDTPPSSVELANGGSISLSYMDGTTESAELTYDILAGETDVKTIGMILYFVPNDGDLLSIDGVTIDFAKAGVWAISLSNFEIASVTVQINGYNGFKQAVIKTIDPKYLPESEEDNHISTKSGDTLIWGASMELMERKLAMQGEGVEADTYLIKLTDEVLPFDELTTNGCTLLRFNENSSEEVQEDVIAASDIDIISSDLVSIDNSTLISVKKPTTLSGLTFESEGTYSLLYSTWLDLTLNKITQGVCGIKIEGYTGFAKAGLKNPALNYARTIMGVQANEINDIPHNKLFPVIKNALLEPTNISDIRDGLLDADLAFYIKSKFIQDDAFSRRMLYKIVSTSSDTGTTYSFYDSGATYDTIRNYVNSGNCLVELIPLNGGEIYRPMACSASKGYFVHEYIENGTLHVKQFTITSDNAITFEEKTIS